MDDYQQKHLEAWLDRRFSSHRRADRLRLKTGLLLLIEEDPTLLETHSWPEMERLVEARDAKPEKAKLKFTSTQIMCHDHGVCLACGDVSSNVEPDARGYHCDACGEDKVYGLEEAALMDAIEVETD